MLRGQKNRALQISIKIEFKLCEIYTFVCH